jgi:hypothetical protein
LKPIDRLREIDFCDAKNSTMKIICTPSLSYSWSRIVV